MVIEVDGRNGLDQTATRALEDDTRRRRLLLLTILITGKCMGTTPAMAIHVEVISILKIAITEKHLLMVMKVVGSATMTGSFRLGHHLEVHSGHTTALRALMMVDLAIAMVHSKDDRKKKFKWVP